MTYCICDRRLCWWLMTSRLFRLLICSISMYCTILLQLEHLLPSLDWISLAFPLITNLLNNKIIVHKRQMYLPFLSTASTTLFYQCFDQSPDLVFHVNGLTPGTQYSLRIAFYGKYNYCCPIQYLIAYISITPCYQYLNAMKIKTETFSSLTRLKLFWRELAVLPNGTRTQM